MKDTKGEGIIEVREHQGYTHRSDSTSRAPEASPASGRAENGTRRRCADRLRQHQQRRAPDRTALHPVQVFVLISRAEYLNHCNRKNLQSFIAVRRLRAKDGEIGSFERAIGSGKRMSTSTSVEQEQPVSPSKNDGRTERSIRCSIFWCRLEGEASSAYVLGHIPDVLARRWHRFAGSVLRSAARQLSLLSCLSCCVSFSAGTIADRKQSDQVHQRMIA
jgi:hypothetical protein